MASVTVTRRQLVVRSGAVAVWAGVGGVALAKRLGAFDEPPPFNRRVFPEPERSAVAVMRAESYEADLEGLLVESLRLVEADVRRRSVVLKPNFVEFLPGSSINTDPRMVVAAANALRKLGASSVVVAEGPGHRRDTEAVAVASDCKRRWTTPACASSTSTRRRWFGHLSRAATWDSGSSGSRVSCARRT